MNKMLIDSASNESALVVHSKVQRSRSPIVDMNAQETDYQELVHVQYSYPKKELQESPATEKNDVAESEGMCNVYIIKPPL
jgi:hypothetical protein